MDTCQRLFTDSYKLISVATPVLSYYPQYKLMIETKSVGSFTKQTCYLLLLANLTRVLFWQTNQVRREIRTMFVVPVDGGYFNANSFVGKVSRVFRRRKTQQLRNPNNQKSNLENSPTFKFNRFVLSIFRLFWQCFCAGSAFSRSPFHWIYRDHGQFV